MCRKLLITLVLIALGIGVLRKTRLGPVMTVAWDRFCTRAEKQITPEERIRLLRKEVVKIDTELKKAVNNLVSHEVDVQTLRLQIDRLKKDQQKVRQGMEELITALDLESPEVVFQGELRPAEELHARLDRMRIDYENRKELLNNKEILLKGKEATIEAADRRITLIKDKKAELVVLVDRLETQLELLKLKQLENRIDIDDSQVSKCEALYQDIHRQLLEEEKRAEMYAKYGLTSPETIIPTTPPSREESLRAAREALRE